MGKNKNVGLKNAIKNAIMRVLGGKL